MSLPNKTNLVTMDFAYQGQPFVSVPSKSTVTTATMDYAYLAQPFVTNPNPAASSRNYRASRRGHYIQHFM